LYDYGYQMHGSAMVIQNYLGTSYLWEKIRIQGGAYGGFATFDRYSGVFNFLSYRDPNLLKSLKNYDGTVDYLRGLELSQDEVTKAIIGTIGSIDSYQLPDAKGYTSLVRHLTGSTDNDRQRIREEVLGTTGADFKRFADAVEAVRDHGHVVVLGAADGIDAANGELTPPLQVTKVL
jgi:hypothetical protein